MNGYKFFRQYGIGSYIADFYCPALKVVVEVDGGQHYSEDGKIYDDQRDKFFRTLDIRTIRFNNLDVLRNLEGVVENLQKELPLTPSFSKRGEVKRSINVF